MGEYSGGMEQEGSGMGHCVSNLGSGAVQVKGGSLTGSDWCVFHLSRGSPRELGKWFLLNQC